MSDDAETIFKEIIRLKEKLLIELNQAQIKQYQKDLELNYPQIHFKPKTN